MSAVKYADGLSRWLSFAREKTAREVAVGFCRRCPARMRSSQKRECLVNSVYACEPCSRLAGHLSSVDARNVKSAPRDSERSARSDESRDA